MNRTVVFFFLVFTSISLLGQYTPSVIAQLPSKLDETSALVYFDDLFWTINDSGNENLVYAFNAQGIVERVVEVGGVQNVDWEALAIDGTYLYIGDFGNNFNNRDDLVIYGLALSDLKQSNVKPVLEIRFKYPDQESRNKTIRKTAFDCEAMLVMDNKIWLFTKDWNKFDGAVYNLDIHSGEQKAVRVNSLNANGLITDAAKNGNDIFLLGYHDYVPVLWIYSIDNLVSFKERIEFPEMYKYQTEGIAFIGDDIYITCEDSKIKQSLIQLNP